MLINVGQMSSLMEYMSFYNLLLLKTNFNYKGTIFISKGLCLIIVGGQIMVMSCHNFLSMVVKGSYYGSSEKQQEFNPYK
ncbi:hypothetical protein CR513_05962, partial [Mucuna pruriens]